MSENNLKQDSYLITKFLIRTLILSSVFFVIYVLFFNLIPQNFTIFYRGILILTISFFGATLILFFTKKSLGSYFPAIFSAYLILLLFHVAIPTTLDRAI